MRVDWRLSAAVAAGLAVLLATQNYVAPAVQRSGASFGRQLLLQSIIWGSWLALSPWIFAIARQWRRSRRYDAAAFAVQIWWAFVISVAHAALAGVVRWLAGVSVYQDLPTVLVASIGTTAGSNILRYAFIAAAFHAVAYHREVRDREVRAARLEGALAQAKLDSLQGRLHPHFLFNTLNSIAALVNDQPDAAQRMIGSLSDLLRASLHADPEREVTLERELDLVRQYVSIQQMRFNDRLSVSIDVPADTQQALVPHLLLQPLVENAIRHGIAPREAPGHVRIAAGREDDRLRLVVEDDGIGLDEQGSGAPGSGFGLQGTRARLQHLYGAAAHVDLQRRVPSGVTATVELPFHLNPVSAPGA